MSKNFVKVQATEIGRALLGHQLGGESPLSSIYLFRKNSRRDSKSLASNHVIGWQAYDREVMGEGSLRQNHRLKSELVNHRCSIIQSMTHYNFGEIRSNIRKKIARGCMFGCMVYQGWHVMKADGLTKGDLIQSYWENR